MIFLKLQLLDCNCMSTQLCSWWRSETTLVWMAKAITVQAEDIKAQATREDFPREIPHTITMASRLRDFTRMYPPVYFGSKTNEDPQEFAHEVHKIVYVMGVNEDMKAELAAYQLKDVAQL